MVLQSLTDNQTQVRSELIDRARTTVGIQPALRIDRILNQFNQWIEVSDCSTTTGTWNSLVSTESSLTWSATTWVQRTATGTRQLLGHGDWMNAGCGYGVVSGHWIGVQNFLR